MAWTDFCELTISDDDWNAISGIKATFININNYPYVKLLNPENWKIVSIWNISLSWTWIWNIEDISGYVYRIWSSTDKIEAGQKWSSVDINLREWSYRWNVYAIYTDWRTWWLSKTYSFHVVSSLWSMSWDKVRLKKDKCPNWDFSDSYYDWTCGKKWWSHLSPSDDFCGVDESNYSMEEKWAYLYSYEYWITTMCPIQTANLDGYLIRSHFAKMISEFAVNVLGMKPEKWKSGCDKFNDISTLNAELRNFVTISCELGLMWLESDWKTPAKSFNPGRYVTRAQFGTVLSRLLFGDKYNVKDESGISSQKSFWYKQHLQALSDYWVMTKIDWNWPDYLERRWRVMIMLERADNYWIFAWKVPAKNGIASLFDE